MKFSTSTWRMVQAAMVVLLLLASMGCHDAASSAVLGSTVVDGSGLMAEEDRSVFGFTSVTLAGIGSVYVTQGGMTSLRVRAEDNLMDYLETEVHGDALVLRTLAGYDLRPQRRIEYHLVVPDLRSVELSGAGEIHGSAFTGSRLSLVRSGVGDIEFSNLDVARLEATSSGIGSIRLDGRAQQQSVVHDSLGHYEARGLQSAETDVTIRGGGNATVWVTDRLDARIDGSGSVYYVGSPVVTRSGSGSGSVVPI